MEYVLQQKISTNATDLSNNVTVTLVDILVVALIQGHDHLRMARYALYHVDLQDLMEDHTEPHTEPKWFDQFHNMEGESRHTTTKPLLWIPETATARPEDPINEPRILQTTTLSFKITVMVNNRDPTT